MRPLVLPLLLLSLTGGVRFGSGHLIDGIFTEPTLEPGYNLVAVVPRGALALNVTELRRTQNYLAIRLQDGSYLLNGNNFINWSGEYEGAGTTFLYHRQSSQNLESFSAAGPLQEPIDVMLNCAHCYYAIVIMAVQNSNCCALAIVGVNEFNRVPFNPFTVDFPLYIVINRIGSVFNDVKLHPVPLDCPTFFAVVLYQEPNPGIVYRYRIPGSTNLPRVNHFPHNGVSNKDVEHSLQSRRFDNGLVTSNVTSPSYSSRRYRKRKFIWKAIGHGECSKSCGGGVQILRHICIKEHTQQPVPEKRCHGLEKLHEIRLRCNTMPCPPRWRGGPWSECSTSCGTGTRTRELECVQEVRASLTMRIADGACMEPRNLPTSEVCEMPPCEEIRQTSTQTPSQTSTVRWTVSVWSQCSTSCGVGKKTRTVTCATENISCNLSEKPDAHEICDLGPCLEKSTPLNVVSAKLQTSQWLFTEWSDLCSAECGTGVQTRRVFCETSSNEERCDESNRPETSRDCSSNKTCSGQWFTGPWTECSSNCDVGEQIRDVVCVTTLRGSLRVVLDMNCPANKPESKRPCRERPCTSTWFISDWTPCSRSCGKGVQKREVRCLNADGQLPEPHQLHCREEDRPVSRRTCNDFLCREDRVPENSHKAAQVQDDPEITNGVENNSPCKDKMANCNLVTQARLCSYQFYQESCCLSCSRGKLDFE